MKNAALVFAALVAISAEALAGEKPKTKPDNCIATEGRSTTTIDCQSTGSTDMSNTKNVSAGKPRLGYDGDPWFLPILH